VAIDSHTAQAVVTDDAVPDLVIGSKAGSPPVVRVIDGTTNQEVLVLNAYETTFTGGVFVALADFNGDGIADIVTSPDQGGSARVRVLDGKSGEVLADFFAIEDESFRGGARVSAADVNGDGTPDLIVGAGSGGGPRVAVYDGRSLRPDAVPVKLFADFFAFGGELRDGVFVSAADLDGDGKADLLFGAGKGGAPRVIAYSAADLLAGVEPRTLVNFFAGDRSTRGGVWVGTRDVNGDGVLDLLVGPDSGSGSTILTYEFSAGSDPIRVGEEPNAG